MRNLPRNVNIDRDRRGNVRLYFRTRGRPRVRLFEKPGTPEFENEVAAARLGIPYAKPSAPAPARAISGPGSLDWLIDAYEKRGAPLVNETLARNRLKMLREIADIEKGGGRAGALPFDRMERRHVVEIRDTIRSTPGAQNSIVKTLSAMFGWAMAAGIAQRNPAAGIRQLKSGDGFHTWTTDEIEKFCDHHAPGTMARRALVIFLFTGLRLSDGATLGRQHLYWRRDPETGEAQRWLKITPRKTRGSSGVVVDIPVLPELAREIDAAGNAMTFLLTEFGAPFSVKGLGNKMRQWCDQAGLPQCSTHGLRKAGATIAAENGADYEMLKAIYGWTNARQASHYVQKARRAKIAAGAGRFLFLDQKGA